MEKLAQQGEPGGVKKLLYDSAVPQVAHFLSKLIKVFRPALEPMFPLGSQRE